MSQSTREIERDVERTRHEIGETTSELRQRLTAGQLFDEASRMFGARDSSEFVANLGRQVRDNPLPILLIGVGVAWLMVSSRRGRYPHVGSRRSQYGALPSRSSNLPTDETVRLIASDKVEGTKVYNRQGERLGHVRNFMIDKYMGEVAYAVMSFGGFLGMGERYHPLPWLALDYDTELKGFVVDLDRATLEGAPHYGPNEDPWASDPDYGRNIYLYYEYHYD